MMNVPIRYNQKKRSKTFLNPNGMTAIRPNSHFDYTEQRAEQDRRLHFGEAKRDESETKEGE